MPDQTPAWLLRDLPGPLANGPPERLYDGLPEPDPGAMERPMEGWTPLRPDMPWHGLHALMDLVGHITYKPGYRLRVDDPGMTGGVFLVLTAWLTDTYHPERQAEQVMRFHVEPWLLERWGEWMVSPIPWPDHARQDILRWVRKCLGHHELHERDEWIRVDGVMVFNPHEGDPSGTRLRMHHQ